jgi:membrane associated rhomboid family serine protease
MSPTLQPRGGFSVFPPFIKFLLFANLGVFFLTDLFPLTFDGLAMGEVALEYGALWPFSHGFMPWQLLSYQYLHGGFGHIFFNMLALWMFGMELENIWGTKRFAVYYTLSGIAAGVAHLIVTPLLGGGLAPTIGASGSVMGVLLAFGMLFPNRPVMMFPIFFPIPARIFVLLYAGIDLFMGVFNSGDGVAHFAHLGGALGGFLLIKFGDPIWNWLDRRSGYSTGSYSRSGEPIDVEYRDVPPYRYEEPVRTTVRTPMQEPRQEPKDSTPTRFIVDGARISQEEIDEILDKISQAGYHSLTDHEKNILYEVSRQI